MNWSVRQSSAPAQRSPRGDVTDTHAQNPKRKPYFPSPPGQGPREWVEGTTARAAKGPCRTQRRQAAECRVFHLQAQPLHSVAYVTSSGAPGQARAKVTPHSTHGRATNTPGSRAVHITSAFRVLHFLPTSANPQLHSLPPAFPSLALQWAQASTSTETSKPLNDPMPVSSTDLLLFHVWPALSISSLSAPTSWKNAPLKTISQKVSSKGSAAQSLACSQPSSCRRPAFPDPRLSSSAFCQRPLSVSGLLTLACPHQAWHLSSLPLERCWFSRNSSLGLKWLVWKPLGHHLHMCASSVANWRSSVALTSPSC